MGLLDDDENLSAVGNGNEAADDIAGQIAAQAPQVQEHAVNAAKEKEALNAPAPVAGTKLDDMGVAFDPAKHTGSKLKSGAWREKKSTLGMPRKSAKPVDVSAVTDAANNARAAGSAAAAMLTGSMTMMMGSEWQPRTERDAGFDEQKFLSQAFGDYFVAKNISDIPPGAALSMALLMYFTSRSTMPQTRSKLQRFKSWIGIRLAARKIRKEFKSRGIVARVEIVDGVLHVDGKEHGKE